MQGAIEESSGSAQTVGQGDSHDTGSRTVAAPDFTGEAVPIFTKKVILRQKPIEEFFAGRTFF